MVSLMLPCCRLTKPFDDTCWVGVRHDTETFSATCVKVERIVGAGGCPVVVTRTALQQLRAGCRCAHEAAPKYLYSHCPEISLEWLVHVTSSSSSSTATVQKAAWNGWRMWPAQALPKCAQDWVVQKITSTQRSPKLEPLTRLHTKTITN